MDLAIINMISDLKFYYNLMYYLINTQMNNNLKIILTTDHSKICFNGKF